MPTKDISESNMAIVTELFKADKFVVMNDDGTLVESEERVEHGKEEDNQGEGTGDGNCKDM